ncbi:MAG TPA: calcium-binding protein [Allosphingosinicella sp.]
MTTGTEGNDTLQNAHNNDSVYGLGGDDIITVSAGPSVGQLTIDGGTGFDILNSSDSFTSLTATRIVIRTGRSGFDNWVDYVNVERLVVSGVYNSNAPIVTGDIQDYITLGTRAIGFEGDLVASLNGGDDRLVVGGGWNTINADLGSGDDFADLSGLSGATPVTINGGDGNDQITTGPGNDTIDGGAGVDVLAGRGGNDIYLVDFGDSVIEAAGGGTDKVFARTTYVLNAGAVIEQLGTVDFTQTSAIDLTGNELNNDIVGNNGNNILRGAAGDDYLTGLEGGDILYGDAGADVMTGGIGNDIYYADSGDTIVEAAGEGGDSLYVSSNFALNAGAHVELLGTTDYLGTTQIDITGNETNNEIVGNDGLNTLTGGAGDDYLRGLGGGDVLIGGAGADFMVGGTGNDVFLVDDPADIVLENAGEGYDAIYTTSSIGLRAGVEVERIGTTNSASTENIYLTGNEFGQEIIANNGNNALTGDGGNDYLVGLDGADLLNGGTGLDVMEGGAGNDIYYVDNAGDVVRESAGGGQDAVYVTASYTLPAGSHVELLGTADFTSTAAINLTGNELVNDIVGNQGANVLSGGGGSDGLRGLQGDDTLIGGTGADILEGGQGADIFRYTALSDSRSAEGVDVLADFTTGTDKIDLSGIDANTPTAGDDAFTSIGTDAFSGKAGELRWTSVQQTTFVYADTDGDMIADFQISVNAGTIASGDFIF